MEIHLLLFFQPSPPQHGPHLSFTAHCLPFKQTVKTVIYFFIMKHKRLNILKKSMNARLKINTLFLNNIPIIFSYNFASIVCYAKHSSETSWHLKHSRVTGKTVLLILGAPHFTDSREPATPSITLAEMFNNNQQGHNTVHFLN